MTSGVTQARGVTAVAESLGNVGTYAQLVAAYPASSVAAGTTAYTTDGTQYISDGANWNVIGSGSGLLKTLQWPASPSQRFLVFAGTQGWEENVVQEPSVWYYAGAYHMVYTGGYTNSRLGYATAPSLFGPWTRNADPILGGTYGGFANGAYHSFVFIEGATGYIYFTSQETPTLLRVATFNVATPETVTVNAKTWALASGGTSWGNVAVVANGSSYFMFLENNTVASSWQTGIATMTSPLSDFTVLQFPCTSLRPSANGSDATPSGGHAFIENSELVYYYHAGPYGALPTDIYRASATLAAPTAFTISNNGFPILARAHPYEVDQVADPYLCQDAVTGKWVMFYEGFDNVTPASRIMQCVGSPTQLSTVGSTQVPALTSANAHEASNQIAQPPRVEILAANTTSTSTSYANYGFVRKAFVAKTNRIVISVAGAISNTTSGENSFFRVVEDGAIVGYLGAVAQPAASGSFQVSLGLSTVLSVVPGNVYFFTLQAKVSGGTLQCRPVAFPEYEQMILSIADAQPYIA